MQKFMFSDRYQLKASALSRIYSTTMGLMIWITSLNCGRMSLLLLLLNVFLKVRIVYFKVDCAISGASQCSVCLRGAPPICCRIEFLWKRYFLDFSFKHKKPEQNLQNLKTFLAELGCGCQIICLTESWCSTDGGNNSIYGLPGYTSVHQVRNNGQGEVGVGGEICIFLYDSSVFELGPDISKSNKAM